MMKSRSEDRQSDCPTRIADSLRNPLACLVQGPVLAAIIMAPGLAMATPVAGTVSAKYFVVAATNPDFNGASKAIPGPYDHFSPLYADMVTRNLGPNGLPLRNPHYAGSPFAPENLDAAGEITFWSPALNKTVSPAPVASGTAAMPFSTRSPAAGSGSFYATAIYEGVFSVTQATCYAANLSTSDEAMLYIDNVMVTWQDGVATGGGQAILQAGKHRLEVFYARRGHPAAGFLAFSIEDYGSAITHEGLGWIPDKHFTPARGTGPLFQHGNAAQ